jgi:hypothetical protein
VLKSIANPSLLVSIPQIYEKICRSTAINPSEGVVRWNNQGRVSITAEAVEKANRFDHFTPDFCVHQSIQKYA